MSEMFRVFEIDGPHKTKIKRAISYCAENGWIDAKLAKRLLTLKRKPVNLSLPSGCTLTAHQFRVLQAVVAGMTVEEIAEDHGCSTHNVKTHLNKACHRLNCRGSFAVAQAVVKAVHKGWFNDTGDDKVDKASKQVTWGQRLYLEAFDQHLKAHEDWDLRRTKVLTDSSLVGMSRQRALRSAPSRDWITGRLLDNLANLGD